METITDLSILDDGQWGADVFEAHAIGCNAVSWAPATRPGALLAPASTAPGQPSSAPVKRFVSAGCDNLVKIWAYSEETQTWTEEDVLEPPRKLKEALKWKGIEEGRFGVTEIGESVEVESR